MTINLIFLVMVIISGLVYWWIFYHNYKKTIGKLGELSLSLGLKIHLSDRIYKVIDNVTIPYKDGTTQIDHIIISEFGVFVIETKNWAGKIFGHEHQAKWKQVLKGKSSPNIYSNPIWQNKTHTKAIQKLLDLKDNQIHSVIAFIGEGVLQRDLPENVTGGGKINPSSYIKSKSEKVITAHEKMIIIGKINNKMLEKSRKTDQQHIEYLNKKFQPSNKSLKPTNNSKELCPKCGAPLIIRTTKSGKNKGDKFYGCSRFPVCRNKKRIN